MENYTKEFGTIVCKKMAPYDPPNAHYTQVNVEDIEEDKMFEFIGKSGFRFYKLTRDLGLRYLWYDKERKVIEIWGSYDALEKEPGIKVCDSYVQWLEKNIV